jgi:Flp pilus assembly protein TadD
MLAGYLGALSLLGPASPGWAAAAGAAEGGPSQALADGLEAFRRGNIEGAATHWQAAARMYAATKQGHAHSVALTHLAHAYAALGHLSQATHSLHTALRLAERTP